MATHALKYTNLLLENAVKELNLGYDAQWFLEELQGHQRWSDEIAVKLEDKDFPGRSRPHYFKIVCVKHRSPDDSWIYAGGWRAHEEVNLSQMENLATDMSIKEWLNGLPYAGAKGGIRMDPRKYSTEEIKNITNKEVEKLVECDIINPFKYRLAPDAGTGPQKMQWICDHYGYMMRLKGRKDVPFEGIVTGKPGSKGISFRQQATGVGMHYALEIFRKGYKIRLPQKPSATVNGCGNVGLHFIKYAEEFGIKIVAVRDIYGAVYMPEGLPRQELVQYIESNPQKSVRGFENVCHSAKAIKEKSEFFSLDADIFVPAALEGDITENEAATMRCKVVLEGANSPTTREGDEILQKRGVFTVPDILANSGGVIVSYFEHMYNIGWTQKYPEAPVPERDDEHVQAALRQYMTENGRGLIDVSKKHNISPRLAGYVLALGRVFPKFVIKRRMGD